MRIKCILAVPARRAGRKTRTRGFAARGFAATRGGFAATHGRGHVPTTINIEIHYVRKKHPLLFFA